MSDDPPQAEAAESAETTPYEPGIMHWRRALPGRIKRMLAPEHSRRRRWWWERLFVRVPTSDDYPDEGEVLKALRRAQGDRSAAVLSEARELFDRPFQTTAGVERRASTLQGSIAIAASFVVAGGGLLLDTSEIHTDGWRLAFAAVYAIVIMSLVFSALRALRATSRVLVWRYPDQEDLLLGRTSRYPSEHELALAAALLYSGARNANNARYKVAQMRAAGHWLALALTGLLLTALLLVAYIADGPGTSSAQGTRAQQASANARFAAGIAAAITTRQRAELERLANRLRQKGDANDRRGAELITGLVAGVPGDAASFAVWAEQSTSVARQLLAEMFGTLVKASLDAVAGSNVTIGGSTTNEGSIYFSFGAPPAGSSKGHPSASNNHPCHLSCKRQDGVVTTTTTTSKQLPMTP